MVTARPNPTFRNARRGAIHPRPPLNAAQVQELGLDAVAAEKESGALDAARKLGMEFGFCAKHLCSYFFDPGVSRRCPACDMDDELTSVRIDLAAARNQLERQTSDLERAQGQSNIITAMRQAVGLLDAGDRTWLKAQVYRWRHDRSIRLKVSERPPGFITMGRGDPELHSIGSIGGSALIDLYDEAARSGGLDAAMSGLARAMHNVLSEEQ